MNPFKLYQRNPGPEVVVNSHESLWEAVTSLRIGQARQEERERYNWLLGIAILGFQVAIFVRLFA